MDFTETDEQRALRAAVAELGAAYGHTYFLKQARSGGRLTELWQQAGQLGFLGVNLPAEHGGGGAGLYELSLVLEELAAAGCGLLLMVVSPATAPTRSSSTGCPGWPAARRSWRSASPSRTRDPTRTS